MMNEAMEALNDFGQLYSRYQDSDPVALQILQGQHRYLSGLGFDPLNGEPLSLRMSSWVSQEESPDSDKECLQDRFTHLLDHCLDAIGHILLSPRQTIVRVHELTPVYLAQRLDSRSVQWLNRKPGNNLREKLAANPHILATTRKMSLDTLENRLLKALFIRVEWLLMDRQDTGLQLTEAQEGLLVSIQRALSLDEFAEVKPWQNMPPNNVLLQDKQYRKVWRAWRWLQHLEEDCRRQQESYMAAGFGIFSEILKHLNTTTRCVLLDQPWAFQMDRLSVAVMTGAEAKSAFVEIRAIDMDSDGSKKEACLVPKAELTLSLSEVGHIRIERKSRTGKRQCWQLQFSHSNGLTKVAVSANIRSSFQDFPVAAMPDVFSELAAQLIAEILPGDSPAKSVRAPCLPIGDFVTLMFDGAGCKVQADGDDACRIGPLMLDEQGLDCSQSRSLSASTQVFSAREFEQADGEENHLGGLSDQLARHIKAKQAMHYLVNDHYSDFATRDLRREINRNFGNAAPLPKSVAAVFAALAHSKFKRDDLVVVLGSDLSGVYATPVYYRWGKKPGDEYLERHPSIRLSRQGEQQLLQIALMNAELPDHIAKRFVDLYSYREIVSTKNHLILQEGESWYRIPEKLAVGNIDVAEDLFREVKNLGKKPENTFFISVSAAIKPQKGIKPSQWLSGDPISGSQWLLKQQSERPDKVFWKDHLPPLMTRLPVQGIERNFYFVDSQTSIKPERDVAVNIPIETSFTLPAGKEELSFTVTQGSGNHRQVFSLLLSLRNALKADCVCKLDLTYTYGAEQPYRLRFSPISTDQQPFHYVEAQWGKKQVLADDRTVAIPAFPEPITFEKLRSYPGKDGPTNVIEWIERNLEDLEDIHQFVIQGRGRKRFNFDYQDIHWIPGKEFGFYKLHPEFGEIFVHRNQFKNLDVESDKYFSGEVLIKDDGKCSLVKVAEQGALPKDLLDKLSGRWRFPMLIFSDQCRSFTDGALPTEFAQKGKRAIAQAQELLGVLAGSSEVLEKELTQFLCYCHKLIPQPVADNLLSVVQDKKVLRKESTWFKYALGDVSQPWQKNLLNQLLEPADGSGGTRAVTLEILSVAIWRERSVIHQLTAKQIQTLAKRLNEHLLDEITRLKKEDKPYQWNSFILRLELLLALVRSRESSDSDISSLLAYDSALCNQLLNTVEKINDKQGESLSYQLHQDKVVSRVKLAVNKPDAYHRTPDLLYALKLYLSGDDGADKITVSELVNSN